jgi:heterodisulfide reductase subunit B
LATDFGGRKSGGRDWREEEDRFVKYSFYIGCLIPAREPGYESVVRKVLPSLGFELEDIKGANCCAPFSIQSLDYYGWLALAARNISLAEKMGNDILAVCDDCYESFSMANKILKEGKEVKDKVNSMLAEVGEEFKGSIEVKHVLEVLHENMNLIKDNLRSPLDKLRVGAHPGCHLVRPKAIHMRIRLAFDVMDDLVKAIGADPVDYPEKGMCCGGPLRGVNDDISRKISREKLRALTAAKVDCVATVCPFCFRQFDLGQVELRRYFKEDYRLPVVHYMELLGKAVGVKFTEKDLADHKIPVEGIVGPTTG